MASHVVLALVSGIVIEALYALNVLMVGERRSLAAGITSFLWGGAFLFGVNESFKTWVAALAWCVGLGIGAAIAVRWLRLPPRPDGRSEP